MNVPLKTPGVSPGSTYTAPAQKPAQGEPPRKPDWLLIMVSVLFLLTLLIVWLMDVL